VAGCSSDSDNNSPPKDTTSPEILSAIPAPGAPDISPTTAITVSFSEQMDPISLNEDSMILMDGDNYVKGVVTLNEKTAMFQPESELENDKNYQVIIKADVCDLAGNHIETEHVFSFSTGSTKDTTPPSIIASTPSCGAIDVSLNTAMSVTFSEPMDPASLQIIPFKISDGENEIGGKISYSGVTATFIPDAELEQNKTYSATISTNPTDLSGNNLQETFSCSFTTGSVSDTTPPSVVVTIPSYGAIDVPLNIAMSVTFSEPMDPASLHIIPFVINDGEKDISGTINYSGVTATFTPNEDLAYNKTYTASISTSPTDLAGNHLESEMVCSFTTGDEPDGSPPKILLTTPSCEAIDVSLNTAMSVTFSEPMDPASLNIIPFVINDGEKDISGTINYSGVTATFTPNEDLAYNKTYTASISTNPTDLAGNHLKSEMVCSFTTGDEPDSTPPKILLTTPSCGATDVSLNTSLSVTFSESMDPASLHIIPFVINDGEKDISGTVTYSGVTAMFEPNEDLQYSKTYTATITTYPTDLAGNHLESETTCSFTTIAKPVTPEPAPVTPIILYTWYKDTDGDLYGNPNDSTEASSRPSGYVSNNGDCNDNSAGIHPGGTETANDGIDQDCDGSDSKTWYADTDGDGFGTAGNSTEAPSQPSEFVADNTDCDDTNADINPGKTEIAGDGIDQDCNGADLPGSGTISGKVKDLNGNALSDVTVTASNIVTVSDNDSSFSFSNIPETSRMVVTFTKENYVSTTKIARVRENENSYIEAVMAQEDVVQNIDAGNGGTITTPDGGSVVLSAGVLVDSDGNPYSGTATVSLTTFDPSTDAGLEAFPGDFEGVRIDGSTEPILSYGYMDITIKDNSGNLLQLGQGQTAEIEIPIPQSLVNSAPATIPLWYFDPSDGKWHEEGAGTKNVNKYTATIAHFSIWNFDVAFDRSYVTGRVVDCDGNPVNGASVTIKGAGWKSGEKSTREDGLFPASDNDSPPGVPVNLNSTCEIWASKNGQKGPSVYFTSASAENILEIGDLKIGDCPARKNRVD